jgi:hypothetical protein
MERHRISPKYLVSYCWAETNEITLVSTGIASTIANMWRLRFMSIPPRRIVKVKQSAHNTGF